MNDTITVSRDGAGYVRDDPEYQESWIPVAPNPGTGTSLTCVERVQYENWPHIYGDKLAGSTRQRFVREDGEVFYLFTRKDGSQEWFQQHLEPA